ncbi:MAG: hypothetical protein U1E14_08445 [Geminicoccaceae bacterium]
MQTLPDGRRDHLAGGRQYEVGNDPAALSSRTAPWTSLALRPAVVGTPVELVQGKTYELAVDPAVADGRPWPSSAPLAVSRVRRNGQDGAADTSRARRAAAMPPPPMLPLRTCRVAGRPSDRRRGTRLSPARAVAVGDDEVGIAVASRQAAAAYAVHATCARGVATTLEPGASRPLGAVAATGRRIEPAVGPSTTGSTSPAMPRSTTSTATDAFVEADAASRAGRSGDAGEKPALAMMLSHDPRRCPARLADRPP